MARKGGDDGLLTAARANDLGQRWIDARNAADAEVLLALCADDIHWEDPQLPEPGGRTEAIALIEWFDRAFPDISYELDGAGAVEDDDASAIIGWQLSGTHLGPMDPPGFPPTGKPLRLRGVDRLELNEDGEVSICVTIYDSLSLGRQLGNIPPAGHPIERISAGVKKLAAKIAERRN